ncbi:MAG: hypothetical protein ACHQIL_13335 [Steroidobacterales bacterium]
MADGSGDDKASGVQAGAARVWAMYYLLIGDLDQGAEWAQRASQRWPKIATLLNLVP